MITVRSAAKEDCGEILRLLSEIGALHSQNRPDIFAKGLVKYTPAELEAILEDPSSPVLVAEKDEKVIGYLFAQEKYVAPSPVRAERRYLYIDDLCVDSCARRMGAARLLMAAAERLAKERGISSLELNVWGFNSGAIAFYKKEGFSEQRIILEKEL